MLDITARQRRKKGCYVGGWGGGWVGAPARAVGVEGTEVRGRVARVDFVRVAAQPPKKKGCQREGAAASGGSGECVAQIGPSLPEPAERLVKRSMEQEHGAGGTRLLLLCQESLKPHAEVAFLWDQGEFHVFGLPDQMELVFSDRAISVQVD